MFSIAMRTQPVIFHVENIQMELYKGMDVCVEEGVSAVGVSLSG